MLEITGDHIALLSDEDLRELVGLLCEAEVRVAALSAAYVTWGAIRTRPTAEWMSGWNFLREKQSTDSFRAPIPGFKSRRRTCRPSRSGKRCDRTMCSGPRSSNSRSIRERTSSSALGARSVILPSGIEKRRCTRPWPACRTRNNSASIFTIATGSQRGSEVTRASFIGSGKRLVVPCTDGNPMATGRRQPAGTSDEYPVDEKARI